MQSLEMCGVGSTDGEKLFSPFPGSLLIPELLGSPLLAIPDSILVFGQVPQVHKLVWRIMYQKLGETLMGTVD